MVIIHLRLADISTPATPVSPAVSPRGIETEKSRAPSFTGKTIDYPEFRRGWAKVSEVHWDHDNQVKQIKFKVDSATRRLISRCSTMSEVWELLDAEYAQEHEVINVVDIELCQLISSKYSIPEYIVMLRNYLHTLEETPKAVNGLDQLQSPDRVNLFTQKFDERSLHE